MAGLVLGALFTILVAACSWSNAEKCKSDDDCAPGEYCASAGGILWSGDRVCAPNLVSIVDGGELPDADVLPDVAEHQDIESDTDTGSELDVRPESDVYLGGDTDSVSDTDVAADTEEDVAEPCAQGLTLCGEGCVDTQVDLAHCGECDEPCGGDMGRRGRCAEGACDLFIDYATSVHTHSSCTEAGGVVVNISVGADLQANDEGTEVCRFDEANCPEGWNEAAHWTTAVAQSGGTWSQEAVAEDTYSCNGVVATWEAIEQATGELESGSHTWSNRDPSQHDVECITWRARPGDFTCHPDCWRDPGCPTQGRIETPYWQSCDDGLNYSQACGNAASTSMSTVRGRLCSTDRNIRTTAQWFNANGERTYRRQRLDSRSTYQASARVIQRGCW